MLEVCFLWTISTKTAHRNILWNSDICIKSAFYHIFWAATVGNRLEYVRSSFYFLMFFYSSRSLWLSHAKSVVLVFIFYCAFLLCFVGGLLHCKYDRRFMVEINPVIFCWHQQKLKMMKYSLLFYFKFLFFKTKLKSGHNQ